MKHCKQYTDLRKEEIAAICRRFHTPLCYARGFLLLANHGQIRGEQFRAFIRTPRGRRVIKAIAAKLSEGLEHEFPPKGYQVPRGYDFYGTQPKSAA